MTNTCAITWFITYSITYHYISITWHVWAHHHVLPSTQCQSSSRVSFQVTLAAPPPPSSSTRWPLFRYVFNAVLSCSRCSAWNFKLIWPAKCCSSPTLGNTCGSMNGNVRWCTLIKDYVRQSSINSRLIALEAHTLCIYSLEAKQAQILQYLMRPSNWGPNTGISLACTISQLLLLSLSNHPRFRALRHSMQQQWYRQLLTPSSHFLRQDLPS